jgi:hypothetical protein
MTPRINAVNYGGSVRARAPMTEQTKRAAEAAPSRSALVVTRSLGVIGRLARGESDRRDHRQPQRQERGKRGPAIDPTGYDAGKKIRGKKRHILVDTQGLLMHTVVPTSRTATAGRC